MSEKSNKQIINVLLNVCLLLLYLLLLTAIFKKFVLLMFGFLLFKLSLVICLYHKNKPSSTQDGAPEDHVSIKFSTVQIADSDPNRVYPFKHSYQTLEPIRVDPSLKCTMPFGIVAGGAQSKHKDTQSNA